MSSKPKHKYSLQQYFALEKKSQIKHEYFNGEIFAMTGASFNHNQVIVNISSELHQQLKHKSCRPLVNDMRVKVSTTGLYTYPDVVVFCGKPELEKIDGLETLLNPVLIVEVLSPTTANYDKGVKFDFYRAIESFQLYLLVDQTIPHVILYVKQSDGKWLMSETKDLESKIELPFINCELGLKDIYQGLNEPI